MTAPTPEATVGPWWHNRLLVGLLAAIVGVVAGTGVWLLVFRTDPGVQACRDIAAKQQTGADTTDADYARLRDLFRDSGDPNLAVHGTRAIDLIDAYTFEHDPGRADTIYAELGRHTRGLTSACADHDVTIRLAV